MSSDAKDTTKALRLCSLRTPRERFIYPSFISRGFCILGFVAFGTRTTKASNLTHTLGHARVRARPSADRSRCQCGDRGAVLNNNPPHWGEGLTQH